MNLEALVLVGLCRNNAKDNGNYHIILGFIMGLYRDDGKEHGGYYLGFTVGF